MCGLKLPNMMEIVLLVGNFNLVKLNRLRNGGSVFSNKPKLGSYRSSKPNLEACIGETISRMLFTREWALMQLNWVKLAGPLPLMGALGNSTSNNHSSVGSSSDKCAFSNSRNSAKDVTEKSVQEFSHVLSKLCEPVISWPESKMFKPQLFPSHVNMGVLKLASLEMSLMKIFCLELYSFSGHNKIW